MCWFKKKKKPLSEKDFFTQNSNLVKFHNALWHPKGGDTHGDIDQTLAFVSIDPSTFETGLPVQRFKLTENEQKVLDAIHEINRFDAPDLSDITFYPDANMNEYTFYEEMLEDKFEKMTGIVDIPHEWISPDKLTSEIVNEHNQTSVHMLSTNCIPQKGHLSGGEYARALKIMKYQTPEEERYKPKIKKTKPKAEPIENASVGAVPKATAKAKFCTQCGALLTPSAKFCISCGVPVK